MTERHSGKMESGFESGGKSLNLSAGAIPARSAPALLANDFTSMDVNMA